MALVDMKPNTKDAERYLELQCENLRNAMKLVFSGVWKRPSSDVVVHPHICTVIDRKRDPAAADVVVYIETNPNEELAVSVDDLRRALCGVWRNVWANTPAAKNGGAFVTAEIWPRFIPGSWCLIKTPSGEIEDFTNFNL